MSNARQALQIVVEEVERAPASGRALWLFGLMSALNAETSGALYRLRKLSEMDVKTRAMAYGLMEYAAGTGIGEPAWQEAFRRVERAIRGAGES